MLARGSRPHRRQGLVRHCGRVHVASYRWVCLSALALMVAMMVTTVSPPTVQGDSVAYVDTDVLNLRAEPGTWADILDKMWQGESVDVVDGPTDDGWYQVWYNGQVGWAYGGYLSINDASGGGDGSTGVGGTGGSSAWVATDRLNMRSDASLDADVLDLLVEGEEITVTGGEINGFVPVWAHGVSAWVWSGYLAWDGPAESGPEHWIDVDRSSGTVTLYVGDEAISTYSASLGYDTSDYGFYSTAIGTYYVYSKWAPLSWTSWGQTYISYWVGFDPERDNGFHSYSMDGNGDVLPRGDGPTGGCVATAPWAAAEIFDFAEIGTRVEVHR